MVLRAKPEKVEERERTRLSLLRATLQLAAEHGYAGLGLREVARGAGIAPTSFYRHFADMEELGLSLVSELVAPLVRGWLSRTQAELARAKHPTRVLIEQARATFRDDPDLVRFVLAERAGASGSCRRALRSELEHWAAGLATDTALGARYPRLVSDAVLTLLLEALASELEPEGLDASAQQRFEHQLALLLRPEPA